MEGRAFEIDTVIRSVLSRSASGHKVRSTYCQIYEENRVAESIVACGEVDKFLLSRSDLPVTVRNVHPAIIGAWKSKHSSGGMFGGGWLVA